jgi:ribosomal protein L29
MKFKALAQMTSPERERKQKELELELIKLNSQVATGTPPKNAGHLKRLKKDIARIMFIKGNEEKNLTLLKEQKAKSALASEPKTNQTNQQKTK